LKSLVSANTYPLALIVPFILCAVAIAFIAVVLLRSYGDTTALPHLAHGGSGEGSAVSVPVVEPKIDAIEMADSTLLPDHIAPVPTIAKIAVARKAVFKADANAGTQGPPTQAAVNEIARSVPAAPKLPVPEVPQNGDTSGHVAGASTETPSTPPVPPTTNPQL